MLQDCRELLFHAVIAIVGLRVRVDFTDVTVIVVRGNNVCVVLSTDY